MARILVIDDEKNVREMVRLALENVGHSVQIAADGDEGLLQFGDGSQFDLVLLDQRLSNETEGTQIFSKMRAIAPETKALLITAYGSISVAIESLKVGIVSLLRKPFSTDQLRAAVTEALLKSAKPAAAVKVDDVMDAISRTNESGLVFCTTESHFDDKTGEWKVKVEVQDAAGEMTIVSVIVPRFIIELAKALANCEAMPGNQQFWIGMAEEALAEYCLVNAKLPPENILVLDDVDAHLKVWLDSVMSVN